MKKVLAITLVMALAFVMPVGIQTVSGECEPVVTGEQLPPGSIEHYSWQLVDNEWVAMGVGNREACARAFSSNPITGMCNKFYWEIPITVHASVAQWVEFSHSGTRYDWRIRKPGTYGANSLTFTLKSNSDICIDFEGFENLKYNASEKFPGVNQEIETWYAYGEGENPGELSWFPAAELNEIDALVEDSCDLHAGLSWKLWNKIRVVECNSACEYQDDAMVTLVLMNQKIWIDGDDGYFKEMVSIP